MRKKMKYPGGITVYKPKKHQYKKCLLYNCKHSIFGACKKPKCLLEKKYKE